jgi:hypothetical protein
MIAPGSVRILAIAAHVAVSLQKERIGGEKEGEKKKTHGWSINPRLWAVRASAHSQTT